MRIVRTGPWLAVLLLGLLPALGWSASSYAFRHVAADPNRTNRIIVKWRASGVAATQIDSIRDRTTQLSSTSGLNLSPVHTIFGRTDVVQLDYLPSSAQMQRLLTQIRANPAIEYAEPDGWRYLTAFPQDPPNDPHFLPSSAASNATSPDLTYGIWNGQWYLQAPTSTTPSALNVTAAWLNTTGSSSIVVAVVDTGVIMTHPDLEPNLVTPGYDFVSCDQGNYTDSSATGSDTEGDCTSTGSAATYYFANDGQNWHADGSDPGDWIDSTDIAESVFINAGCTTVAQSSWHGTKVAGVIGAVANNGIGIAGIAPDTRILPVRVIGKCAARVSDIAAAILWAGGQDVTIDAGDIASSPAANIINLSLGANTACSSTEQDAITTVTGAGTLVVAAAGNEGGALDAPANCTSVLSVVGLRETGTKVPYSDYSSADAAATIAAPGGNCVNTGTNIDCLYDIETTSDSGTGGPSTGAPDNTTGFYTYSQFTSAFYDSSTTNLDNQANVGTSFAAPMASGVAALMLAGNPALTPGEIIARMQSSAVAFPTSSSTTSTQCVLAATTTDSNGDYIEPTTPSECVCTTSTCGSGMLNASTAYNAAVGIYADIVLTKTVATAGSKVGLNATASTPSVGATITSYQWTTDPSTSDQIIDPNSSIATLIVPSFRSITVVLTIVDSSGKTAVATAKIQSSFGDGGGAFDLTWLAVLALATGAQLWRRRRNRHFLN